MDTRNPSSSELPDLINRVSKAFSYNIEEGTVARDFPQLYNPANLRRLWMASEGPKACGHAGYFPNIMKVESLPLPVIGIGGVYTEPEFQGQGLASQLIKKCCDEGAKEGAALAFLWSDKHEFYAKLGFTLVGRQWTIELDPSKAAALREAGNKVVQRKDLRIADGEVTDEFLAQSFAILESNAIGISRTLEDHVKFMTSGSCRVIGAWVGDQLAGYFLIGKGKDLPGYVHEWGGMEAALHHLAAECLETFEQKLFVLSPQFMPDEVEWIYSLDDLGIQMRAEFLALVKLLDFEKVRKLLGEYMVRLGLQAEDLVVKKLGENSFEAIWRETTVLTFGEQDFLRFLFGPEPPDHPDLKAFLPLRLWYWGMDSV